MHGTPKKPKEAATTTTVNRMSAGGEFKYTASGYMEIKSLVSGRVKCVINSEEYELIPGNTLVVNPYDEVELYGIEDSLYYGFLFDSPRFFDELNIPALIRFQNVIKDDVTVNDICRRVNDEYENRSTFYENMLTFLIDQLLIHLYRNYGNNNSEKPSAQLIGKHRIAFLAIQYIYENCQNNLSTKDVSAHINVSTSYLCRCFKEATGISVLDFYERIRCRRAREDLSLGTYSVTQVAEKYNFNSLSYFNRRYKKYCGTAPMTTLTEAKKRRAAIEK